MLRAFHLWYILLKKSPSPVRPICTSSIRQNPSIRMRKEEINMTPKPTLLFIGRPLANSHPPMTNTMPISISGPAHEAVMVNILERARAEAGRHQGVARLLAASVADLAVVLLLHEFLSFSLDPRFGCTFDQFISTEMWIGNEGWPKTTLLWEVGD